MKCIVGVLALACAFLSVASVDVETQLAQQVFQFQTVEVSLGADSGTDTHRVVVNRIIHRRERLICGAQG